MGLYEDTFAAARRIIDAARPADPELASQVEGVFDVGEPVDAAFLAMTLAAENDFPLPAAVLDDLRWLISYESDPEDRALFESELARVPVAAA